MADAIVEFETGVPEKFREICRNPYRNRDCDGAAEGAPDLREVVAGARVTIATVAGESDALRRLGP